MKQRRFITHVGWSGGLILCFLFVSILSVLMGSTRIPVNEVFKVLGHHLFGVPLSVDPTFDAILWSLRLPRVCLAAAVGGVLALAGVIYQGLLRNPLADPYILGISSGSATGAILAIVTGWGMELLGIWSISIWAFVGAGVAMVGVFMLSGRSGSSNTLLLAGVIIHAFFGAIITFLISISSDQLPRIQFWLMGSFTLREWSHVWVLVPVLVLGILLAWSLQRELNVMAIGERTAIHLGVPVTKMRLFLILLASFLTAVAVSISGIIGFVGLVIPHMIRMLTGANHQTLIPYSVLAGASFLVVSDLVARTILEPRELPIGVITALVGAPFFAYLLRTNRHHTTM